MCLRQIISFNLQSEAYPEGYRAPINNGKCKFILGGAGKRAPLGCVFEMVVSARTCCTVIGCGITLEMAREKKVKNGERV